MGVCQVNGSVLGTGARKVKEGLTLEGEGPTFDGEGLPLQGAGLEAASPGAVSGRWRGRYRRRG